MRAFTTTAASALGHGRLSVSSRMEPLEKRELLSASAGAVTDFALINSTTDVEVMPLTDGSVVDLSKLPGGHLNIRATTSPGVVGSVRLSLSGSAPHIENVAPYALFGNTANDYFNGSLAPGSYTLTGVPLSKSLGKGVAGEGKTVHFQVVNQVTPPPEAVQVVALSLIDTRDNHVAAPLIDGSTIDLQQLSLSSDALNIRADTLPAKTGSVRLVLDGVVHVENIAPYALFGNTGDIYTAGTLAPGQHTLTVTPFTSTNAHGTAGTAETVTFTITNNTVPDEGAALAYYIDRDRNGTIDANEAPLADDEDFDFGNLHQSSGTDSSDQVTDEVDDKGNVIPGKVLIRIANTGATPLTLDGDFTFYSDPVVYAGRTPPDDNSPQDMSNFHLELVDLPTRPSPIRPNSVGAKVDQINSQLDLRGNAVPDPDTANTLDLVYTFLTPDGTAPLVLAPAGQAGDHVDLYVRGDVLHRGKGSAALVKKATKHKGRLTGTVVLAKS